jgi:hypothetical protein
MKPKGEPVTIEVKPEPTRKDLESALDLAKEVSPLLAEMFNAKEDADTLRQKS